MNGLQPPELFIVADSMGGLGSRLANRTVEIGPVLRPLVNLCLWETAF